MRTFKFPKFITAVALISLTSCEHDDDNRILLDYTICVDEIVTEANKFSQQNLEVENWPSQIRTYFTSEFSGFAISNIESYMDAENTTFYLLEATNGGQLLFSNSFDFICGDDTFQIESGKEDDEIAIEDLPQAILDYIAINYPGIEIDEAEYEDGEYEIELKDGTELCFDQAGNFIGEC